MFFGAVCPVAVELPEKQGLKQFFVTLTLDEKKSCSGTSRKTRIETEHCSATHFFDLLVAVELPEKQGLKPIFKPRIIFNRISCSGTSRKTRIETSHRRVHIAPTV